MTSQPRYAISRELPKLPAALSPERIKAANNPQARCPAVIVADCSGSMAGPPILELQEALHQFFCTLADDPVCQTSVEAAVVTCGGEARLAMPFTSLLEFDRSQLLLLETSGGTPLGAALCLAIDAAMRQRRANQRLSLAGYKPVVVIMSDGMATDSLQPAIERLQTVHNEVQLILVGIGPHADMSMLGQLAQPNLPPLRLADMDFRTLFRLLSDSFRNLGTSGRTDTALMPLMELLP